MNEQDILKLIDVRAKTLGVDPAAVKAIIQKESTFNPNAKNPDSSAAGLGQFVDKTWKVYGKGDRYDPVASIDATIRYMKHNAQKAGIPVDTANAGKLYLMHFAGEENGKKLIDADANANISAALSPEQISTNKLQGKTVGQVRAMLGDRVQKWANQWAGVPSTTAISDGNNMQDPTSQTSAVAGYNQQMLDAAQKIADNNLSAVNNFGWNPNVKDSSAQLFGKSVQAVTDAQTKIANDQRQALSRYNPDGTRKSLAAYAFDHILGARSENINSRALAKIQAEQANTGKVMTDQVNNMKSALEGTVVNPAYYDKSASNLTAQQQADNQTYNAVTNNYNTQQQSERQYDIAAMHNETEKAKLALASKAQEGDTTSNSYDGGLITAAKSIGINLPDGMKRADIVAALGDKLPMVQAIADNNGSLGSDPYLAVQAINSLGTAAPAELVKQAYIHNNFQQEIIKKIPAESFKPTNATLDKATIAANTAYNENLKRVAINKAYKEAANGEGNWAQTAGNPYTFVGGDIKTLSNGLVVPKGIDPVEIGKLSAYDFISKATQAGASSVEIANFYRGLTTNATKDTNFKMFNAPTPSGKFMVKLRGVDDMVDLATAAGVERFKAIVKSYSADSNSFAGYLGGSSYPAKGAYADVDNRETGQYGRSPMTGR